MIHVPSRHICIGHVKCEWFMQRMHETETCLVSRRAVSHVALINESCHKYEWVTSRNTQGNESCRTYECVMSHIWMRQVTRMNKSCLVKRRATSHAAQLNEHIATHCNTLQHTATRKAWRYTFEEPKILMQHTATHCNTPQHTRHDVIHLRSQQSWYNTL